MLQRLATESIQVNAGNTSKKLLNWIRQVICFLCWEKKVTKNLYNNTINSMKLLYKMYSIFVNSEISTSYDPHTLLVDFYWIKQT